MQGFESNVRGTWTLLQACLEDGVDRVVFASSDKAYGAHDELPYREDFPLQPTASTWTRRRSGSAWAGSPPWAWRRG